MTSRPDLDVADEADGARVEHLVQRVDDALDARVVGRDAVADQAVRRGQRLEQVDRDLAAGLVDLAVEDVAGVDAGGTGADDRDTEGDGSLLRGLSGGGVGKRSVDGGATRIAERLGGVGAQRTTSPTTTTAGERMPRRAACSAIVSSVPTVTRWRGP